MSSEYTYLGNELDVFCLARNWKSYWRTVVSPYLGAEVLEVGAGIGANTELLCSGRQKRWVCLEPDGALLRRLVDRVANSPCKEVVEARSGTISSISKAEEFDTILYIDVLEHVEDDRRELDSASRRLRCGGTMVVLAPAHQWLYSPFDQSIGHWRRYSSSTLAAAAPVCLFPERLIYLDSVGLLASAANLLCLRQRQPTSRQIKFWDERLVPLSVLIDKHLGFALGKTVVGFWRKRS